MTCITYNFHTYTRIFHFFKINYLKNRKLKFSLLDSQLQQEKVLNRRKEKKTFTTIFCNLLSKQNLQSFHHNYANSKEKLISQMIISKQKKKEKNDQDNEQLI